MGVVVLIMNVFNWEHSVSFTLMNGGRRRNEQKQYGSDEQTFFQITKLEHVFLNSMSSV